MSKLSKSVKTQCKESSKTVTNYMNGTSYKVNPIDTLKIVTSSSIFGEPSYYRNGAFARQYNIKNISDTMFLISSLVKKYDVIAKDNEGKLTSDIMESAIDKALDYDFESTLKWAVELRTNFNMRLNPQIIMVRAAIHPKRGEFTSKNPGLFNSINEVVMSRLDEPATQLTYWLYKHKSKNKIPNILKKSWAKKYENSSKYQLSKYKNAGIGMIDTMRVCHPRGDRQPVINELLSTGTIKIEDNNTTWENLKSNGKTWKEILSTIKIGHMALLRNLRNIFTEINNKEQCDLILKELVDGVANGKQFPFRYYTAKKIIEESNVNFKSKIIDTLEDCIDKSTENLPHLKGKTICLSDNSGSAWGTVNSEYGSVTVADIANLSSVITAKNSEEGYVGVFGDTIKSQLISKKSGTLMQHQFVNKLGRDVGHATEGGIWEFFINAINKKEHWDNIFIYSDMQAGHGELYGTSLQIKHYQSMGFNIHNRINLLPIIELYRKEVNPKVNIYTIQVAGYDNVILPENLYRTSILYGWTGKEILYAKQINDIWDQIDNKKIKDKNTENIINNNVEDEYNEYIRYIQNIKKGVFNLEELNKLEDFIKNK